MATNLNVLLSFDNFFGLVKVEVHSSSSGAGSDENLSSSDLSERSGEHEHDYEDIYLVREETNNKKTFDKNNNNTSPTTTTTTATSQPNTTTTNNAVRSRSRDSGSHSRSGSASSSNSACNVVVKLTSKDKTNNNTYKSNEFLPKPQKYEKIDNKKQQEIDSAQESGLSSTPSSVMSSEDEPEKTKLAVRHSMPPKSMQNNNNERVLKRVTSVPVDMCPPPPPPPPPNSDNTIISASVAVNVEQQRVNGDEEPRGAECVEIIEEPTLKPSDILKGSCRNISALSKLMFFL